MKTKKGCVFQLFRNAKMQKKWKKPFSFVRLRMIFFYQIFDLAFEKWSKMIKWILKNMKCWCFFLRNYVFVPDTENHYLWTAQNKLFFHKFQLFLSSWIKYSVPHRENDRIWWSKFWKYVIWYFSLIFVPEYKKKKAKWKLIFQKKWEVALRASTAVTRLTIYRRPQVPVLSNRDFGPAR